MSFVLEQEKTPAKNDPRDFIKRLRRLRSVVARLAETLEKGDDVTKITKRFREIEVEFSRVREVLGDGEQGAEALVAQLDEGKREKWLREVEALGREIEEGYSGMMRRVEESRENSLDKLGVIRKAKGVLDSFFGRKQNKEPRFFDRKG